MPNETFQEADLDWEKAQYTHPFCKKKIGDSMNVEKVVPVIEQS